MSTYKSPDSFGPEFEQALTRGFREAGLRFRTPSPGHAKAFRAKFYHYFRSLKDENLRLDLLEMSQKVQLRLDGDTLVIESKDDAWELQIIRDALGLREGFHQSGNEGSPGVIAAPDLMGTRLKRELDQHRANRSTPKPEK